jgi:hypothetical protein
MRNLIHIGWEGEAAQKDARSHALLVVEIPNLNRVKVPAFFFEAEGSDA